MDDVLLLPWLRRLTMIQAVTFPPIAQAYLDTANGTSLVDYSKHAV